MRMIATIAAAAAVTALLAGCSDTPNDVDSAALESDPCRLIYTTLGSNEIVGWSPHIPPPDAPGAVEVWETRGCSVSTAVVYDPTAGTAREVDWAWPADLGKASPPMCWVDLRAAVGDARPWVDPVRAYQQLDCDAEVLRGAHHGD